jgi:hypothetical protein
VWFPSSPALLPRRSGMTAPTHPPRLVPALDQVVQPDRRAHRRARTPEDRIIQ